MVFLWFSYVFLVFSCDFPIFLLCYSYAFACFAAWLAGWVVGWVAGWLVGNIGAEPSWSELIGADTRADLSRAELV